MSAFTLEEDLLRAVTRRQLRPDETVSSWAPALDRVDWNRVLWRGRLHGVLPFLREALQIPVLAQRTPAPIADQLQQFFEVQQLRTLARARDICAVHDLFERAAIPAVLMDRCFAAHGTELGRADPLERQVVARYAVPVEERARAEAVLTAAGHWVRLDAEKLIVLGKIPVLLHQGLAAHSAASRLAERSDLLRVAGRAIRCIGPLHGLLHLVQTTHRPEKPTLGRAWEIAEITQTLAATGWENVQDEAERFGLAEAVMRTVATSHRVLGLPVPTFVPAVAPTVHDAPPSAPGDASPGPTLFAPFLVTPETVVTRMLALAGTQPHDLVCDLGCGDGRFLITAAKDFGARACGVDVDPERIAADRAQAAAHGVGDRISLAVEDIFATNVSEASVIICYLLPELQRQLERKLRAEARPGARIVSHDFTFAAWPPEKTELIRARPGKISQIYLWRVP